MLCGIDSDASCFTSAANDFCAFRLDCLLQRFPMKLLPLFSHTWPLQLTFWTKNTSPSFIVTFNESGIGRPATSFGSSCVSLSPLTCSYMQNISVHNNHNDVALQQKYNSLYFVRGSLAVLLFCFVLPLLLHPPKTLCMRIFKRLRGRAGWGGGCWRCSEMVLFRLWLQPTGLWAAVAFCGVQQACQFDLWPRTLSSFSTKTATHETFALLGTTFRETEIPFLCWSAAHSELETNPIQHVHTPKQTGRLPCALLISCLH